MAIKSLAGDGLTLDANGDGEPGGQLQYDFRTLPLSFVPETSVFGFIYDSYNQDSKGNDIPIVGATISLDADPSVFAVTDETGFFELGIQDNDEDGHPDGLPAPDFFVHIDGSTAVNAPGGTSYATLGKPFHSVPGQRTPLEMAGETFAIYLPPMAASDIVELSPNDATIVGLGTAGEIEVREMFADDPERAQAIIDELQITYPAGSAQDADGSVATRAAVIPVDPNRLPAPLPSNLQPDFVFSVQAGTEMGFNLVDGNLSFDVPAQVRFPNLDGAAPGEQAVLMSFDHDAGIFKPSTVATVSNDGSSFETRPGTGIDAPGWHFLSSGSLANANAPGGSQFQSCRDFIGCFLREWILSTVNSASPKGLPVGMFVGSIVPVAEQLGLAFNGQADQVNPDVLKDYFNDQIRDYANGVEGLAEDALAGGLNEDLPEVVQFLNGFKPIDTAAQNSNDQEDDASRDQLVQVLNDLNVLFEVRNLAVDSVSILFGSTKWETAISSSDAAIKATLISNQAFLVAHDREVSEQERELIKQLPRPFGILDQDIDDFIDRTLLTYQNYANGILHQSAAADSGGTHFIDVANVRDHLDALNGIVERETNLGYDNILARPFQALERLTASVGAWVRDHIAPRQATMHVLLRAVESGETQRLATTPDGALKGVFLNPQTRYRVDWLDPINLTVAVTHFDSAPSGAETTIPVGWLLEPDSPDDDQDGLANEIEVILGTSPNQADTDGDGISDSVELQRGTDPLGGRAFPTGVIASVPLSGEANEVVLSNGIESESLLAYLATGSHGLAIVDASDFDLPIVLGQLNLNGEAQDVVVDSASATAVVAAVDGGLHFVDVSDPMVPQIIRTASFKASQVEWVDGLVYASSESEVRSFGPVSGELLEAYLVPESTAIIELAHDANVLYAMDDSNVLHVLETNGLQIQKRGSVALPQGGGGIAVDRGIAYIGAQPSQFIGGFVTVGRVQSR